MTLKHDFRIGFARLGHQVEETITLAISRSCGEFTADAKENTDAPVRILCHPKGCSKPRIIQDNSECLSDKGD